MFDRDVEFAVLEDVEGRDAGRLVHVLEELRRAAVELRLDEDARHALLLCGARARLGRARKRNPGVREIADPGARGSARRTRAR